MGRQDPLVDADALLSLARELRTVRQQVEDAPVTDEQRQRWQRALGGIAEGAADGGPDDLERATAQLRRLAATVERAAG